MFRTLIFLLIESLSFFIVFRMTIKTDKDYASLKIGRSEIVLISLEILLSSFVLYNLRQNIVYGVFVAFTLSLLLSAAILDKATTLIPDWVYYFSALFFVPIVIIEYVNGDGYSAMLIVEAVLFVILQLFAFSRTFGFSDALAYSAFGLLCFSLKLGWETMMTGMILSYLFLIVFQLIRRNITKKLKFRKPVPFIPYIFASYCLVIGFALFMRG